MTRRLFTISDGTTTLLGCPPTLPHHPASVHTTRLCHNAGLSLKPLRAALIATLARLQDKAAQLGLKSQLHLLKQSLWHYSGQIWEEEFGNKGFLCSNAPDEPDEFQLMNLNTRIMQSEQRPKGRRDREETPCHHERKDGQRRRPKGLHAHSAWLPICHHGNCLCVYVKDW